MTSTRSDSLLETNMDIDLLGPARKRIVEASVQRVVVPPSNLLTTGERLSGLLGGSTTDLVLAGAGVGLGATLGLHTGFAFIGTAVSGAWVLAPLFGLAAVVAGRAAKD